MARSHFAEIEENATKNVNPALVLVFCILACISERCFDTVLRFARLRVFFIFVFCSHKLAFFTIS